MSKTDELKQILDDAGVSYEEDAHFKTLEKMVAELEEPKTEIEEVVPVVNNSRYSSRQLLLREMVAKGASDEELAAQGFTGVVVQEARQNYELDGATCINC